MNQNLKCLKCIIEELRSHINDEEIKLPKEELLECINVGLTRSIPELSTYIKGLEGMKST